jgi:hypothetical protein
MAVISAGFTALRTSPLIVSSTIVPLICNQVSVVGLKSLGHCTGNPDGVASAKQHRTIKRAN